MLGENMGVLFFVDIECSLLYICFKGGVIMADTKRKRRTKQEIIASIDEKIQYHKEHIATLEEKKERLLNPPVKEKSMAQVIKEIKEKGFTKEQIAEKFGVEL